MIGTWKYSRVHSVDLRSELYALDFVRSLDGLYVVYLQMRFLLA